VEIMDSFGNVELLLSWVEKAYECGGFEGI
jgi:hypothetical protein